MKNLAKKISAILIAIVFSFSVMESVTAMTSNMLSSLDQETADILTDWATYIVVGAGAAGSVVAARLAENPKNNVLVIELGPNNLGNHWIEQPSASSLLWEHPDGPRPSPTSLAFETAMQLGRRYRYPRGDGAGGSTNHHSLIDGRGSAHIYDNIAELVGDQRWSYRNILPYFKKMESYNVPLADTKFHGSTGWLNIKKGTVKSPLHRDFLHTASKVTSAPIRADMSGDPKNADGVGITDLQITPQGKRSSAFEHLLVPHMARNDNIIVLFNTLATRVLTKQTDTGLVAVGIECLHKPHAYLADTSANTTKSEAQQPLRVRFNARNEVILSGGAINTPQLLLLSGIGPRQHLLDMNIPVVLDHPGVGTDLMDHHEAAIVFEVDPLKMVWPAQATTIIDNIDSYLKRSPTNKQTVKRLLKLKSYLQKFADRTEQRETSGGIVLDWYSGLDTDIGHDLHIHSGEGFWFDFDLSSTEPLPDGKLRTDYLRSQHDILHPDFLRVLHQCLIEVLKVSQANGTIRLASADPTVPPIIDLALYKDDEATERIARGMKMVREIVRHPQMKSYYKLDANGNPLEIFPGSQVQTLDQLKYYLKRWSAFGHHISGTAKMGRPSQQNAVIDSKLRVFGIPNLRIVDTSVYPFPYLHGYNTSRGAYLVGEIGADLIKETHKWRGREKN